jgi:hypothetical protein
MTQSTATTHLDGSLLDAAKLMKLSSFAMVLR